MGKQMGKTEDKGEMLMIRVIVSEHSIMSLPQGQRRKSLFYSSIKGCLYQRMLVR